MVLLVTLAVLLSGTPVAFGLGAISIAFILFFQGFDALHVVAETFYAGLNDFTLVSIPMFVMMGAAIGSSPAGKDLYEALDRWLYRLPGGLVISNLGACALFAALTGSSPACCAAIGKMGIPEMRRRGYPDEIATGSICAGGTLGILIPPSITFILYGIATETSIGRLFLAGVVPGLMLTGLFMLWTLFAIWRRGFRAHAPEFRYSWKEKFQSVPKVAPFLAIIVGVMYVLYGVRTSGYVSLASTSVDRAKLRHATSYGPVNAWAFRRLLRNLSLPRTLHFADLGCGLGRACILAAEYGFEKVTGVELAPELCAVARENMSCCRLPESSRSRIKIVEGDVLDYCAATDDDVFFV